MCSSAMYCSINIAQKHPTIVQGQDKGRYITGSGTGLVPYFPFFCSFSSYSLFLSKECFGGVCSTLGAGVVPIGNRAGEGAFGLVKLMLIRKTFKKAVADDYKTNFLFWQKL